MKETRRKTVSGKNVIVLKREKSAPAVCGNCGNVIHGLKKVCKAEAGKLSKTQKTVSRPYGGMYCASCSREIFKTKARLI